MWKRTALIAGLGLLLVVVGLKSHDFLGPGRGGPGRPGRGMGRMPSPDIALVGMEEVQNELKLTDEQKKQVAEFQQELQTQMQAAFAGLNFQELQDLEPEEREKQMAERRQKGDAATKQIDEKLKRILDDSQKTRLGQLRLQREGISAFMRAEIVKGLALNDEQQKQLRELQEQNAFPFAPPDQRQKAQADALAVLTEAQRTQWEALRGAEFKFPEPPRGPLHSERKLVKQFDKDGNGLLNAEERQAAREFAKSDRGPGGRGGGGFGPPGGGPFGFGPPPGGGPPGFGPPGFGPPGGGPPRFGRGEQEPTNPGAKITPADVAPLNAPLYDTGVLRTLFLEFENEDWEAELADFFRSDVEVPATLIADGKKYPNVGVGFRGMSSYMTVRAGQKRSLNLSLDFVEAKQRLQGYKTLNLLNSHEDPTFLHTVLYFQIARHYIPAPKANFIKLAINGESWGVYVNAQQFNKEFIAENFPKSKGGSRWKVPGSPHGRGGLEYLGEDLEQYKLRYEIKSSNSDTAWKKLVALCKTLNETPLDDLEKALEPLLDLDGVLWFLALENALINSDGYWIRASDYCLYLDDKGKFHVIPHDANETFQPPMGPGMGGGGGRGGAGKKTGDPPGRGGPPAGPPNAGGSDLDPLVGIKDTTKPLRSRLLAVPSLKTRYLEHVRTIATDWLDWKKLGPLVDQHVALIGKEIEADTRKLTSYAAFQQATAAEPSADPKAKRQIHNIRIFAETRREFLLSHPEIKKLGTPEPATK